MDDSCTSGPNIHNNCYFGVHHLLNVSYQGLKLCAQLPQIFLHCRCYKRRHSKSTSQLEISNVAYSINSTPSSNGRSSKDEDLEIDEKAILADQTDQAAFQNTAYCKY